MKEKVLILGAGYTGPVAANVKGMGIMIELIMALGRATKDV